MVFGAGGFSACFFLFLPFAVACAPVGAELCKDRKKLILFFLRKAGEHLPAPLLDLGLGAFGHLLARARQAYVARSSVERVGRSRDQAGFLQTADDLACRARLDAEARGIKTQNGLWMLIAQAKEGSSLFTGKAIDEGEVSRIYEILSHESRNLVLVGMPGSGKSTVSSILSRKTGRDVHCLDQIISLSAGMPIPEIFAQFGEAYFRELESFTLCEYAKHPGMILDCGGGIVTRKENFEALRQNGFVVFLNRGWDKLPTDGRPLSDGADLEKMYENRLPLYRAVCDLELDTTDLSPEETAETILEAFLK